MQKICKSPFPYFSPTQLTWTVLLKKNCLCQFPPEVQPEKRIWVQGVDFGSDPGHPRREVEKQDKSGKTANKRCITNPAVPVGNWNTVEGDWVYLCTNTPHSLAKRHSQGLLLWTFTTDRAGSGHPRKSSGKGSGSWMPNPLNEKGQGDVNMGLKNRLRMIPSGGSNWI